MTANLKEAVGKALVVACPGLDPGNTKRIEAACWGETANIVKARNLHGTARRRSDRHKREGGRAIPGEIW